MRLLPFLVLLAAARLGAQEDPAPVDHNAVRAEAFAAERRGDANAAAEAFLKLSQLEPTDPDWIVRAADNLGKSGRFNDALDLLEGARGRFPDVLSLPSMLARTYHLKADTMRAQGVQDANVLFQYQDAVRVARQVLAIDPRQLDARLILASAQFQLGESADALTEAEKVVELFPGEYGGHAMVGRICFQAYVDAKQRLAANDLEETDRVPLVATLDLNRERAVRAFEAAAKSDPARAFPRQKLGDVHAWEGDLDGALTWYGQAMEIDPKTPIDHGWLRTAVDADRRRAFYAGVRSAYAARPGARPDGEATIAWYEGQAAYDQAANSKPATPPAERAKSWKEAADLFARSLEALPDYADTYWWLMSSQYWAGDNAGATKTAVAFARKSPRRFADMVRRDEQTIATLTGMAADLYGKGRLTDSRDVNLVIAYAKQTADAWNNFAFLCRETGQFEESLNAYEQALAIEPESPQLMNDAGVILQYHTEGDAAQQRARRLYQDAIRLAERQLAGGSLEGDALERTRTALRDARANLAKMR